MKLIRLLLPTVMVALLCAPSFGQSVGNIEGVFDVSDMGAANYSIAVKAPEGVAGLEPTLNISYSSHAGNGLLGMGWVVSGLSTINRTGNSIYHDKKVNAIDLSLNDKFSLDGNRLILTSGASYGAANTYYRTEVETFKDIFAVGTFGNGPFSFTVKDQNGVTYEYGGAGYCVASFGNTPYTWLLRRVTDLTGNYISYNYTIANGIAYPDYIAYNGNDLAGTAPQSFIRFEYAASIDPNFTYLAGGKVVLDKHLTKITTQQLVAGVAKTYRSYEMTYDNDFYSHLRTVKEKGTEALEELKPTEFQYGNPGTTLTSTLDLFQTNTQYVATGTGDFNGDGKTDVIRYSTQNTNSNFQVYTNTSTATTTSFSQTQSGVLQSNPNVASNYNTLQEQARVTPFDYNGDGFDDFLYMQSQNYSPCNCSATSQAFFVYTSNGTTLAPLDRKIVSSITPGSNDGFGNLWPLIGDFDGDNKSEVLLVGSLPNNTTYQYASFLVGQEYNVATTSPTNAPVYLAKNLGLLPFAGVNDPNGSNPNDIYGKPKLFTIDYNGDGKNEVLVIRKDANNNSHAKIYSLNVTFDANNKPVLGSPAFILVSDLGYPSVFHEVFIGDFNGDQISDVLTYHATPGWEIGYGNGNGGFQTPVAGPPLNVDPYYNSNGVIRPILISDFNGDGKDDVYNYFIYPQNQSAYPPKTYYSKGNNVFDIEFLPIIPMYLGSYQSGYWLGDFNGDGSADFITREDYYAGLPRLFNFHCNESRHLLSQVKNGFGALTKITYQPLTNNTAYTPGTSLYYYPYIKKTIPLRVVSNVNTDDGNTTTGNNTTYKYEGLKFNVFGKGAMGFDKITSFDATNKMKQEKVYWLQTTYAYPFLQSTIVSYVPNLFTVTPLSSAYPVSNIYSYGNNRIFPYISTNQETNFLTGETIYTTNNYSFYTPPFTGDSGYPGSNYTGKPTSITTNRGNGLEITTQTFSYPYRLPTNVQASSGEPYSGQTFINSKPYKVVTSTTRQGQTAYSRLTRFNYHNNFGYLLNTISDSNTSNAVRTAYWYDYYGNPLRKYTTAAGLPDVDNYYTYDGTHRYVTLSYNGAFPNIKTTAQYDPLSGLKLKDIAPDGFTTTYTYDAFGREKSKSDNNGMYISTGYSWGGLAPGDNIPSGGAYYIGTISTTGAKNYTYFDRLGREIKNKSNNFQNVWVNTVKGYNNKGKLTVTSKPYTGMTYDVINNTYDAYGRLSLVAAPEGNTSYTYSPVNSSPYTVTETNMAGQKRVIKTDASGRQTEVTDDSGNTLYYTYHSSGNVKTVSTSSAVLENNTYDACGRITDKSDPNYGSYLYTYNAYGQTVAQSDPQGNNIGFKYDALGRMYQKSTNEGPYDYIFENNTGINCGKLMTLKGPEGAISYTYGLGDQVSTITHDDYQMAQNFTGTPLFSQDPNAYNTQFLYDSYGRLSFKQYPTGVTVGYVYNGYNGDLQIIYDNATGNLLFNKTSENDAGQITSYTQDFGAGTTLTTTNTYNNFNLLTDQTTQSSGNSSQTLRSYQYNFDPASGHLLTRKDGIHSLAENFQYDNLNRLKKIEFPNNDIDLDYFQNGNIKGKTDAGVFSYDQANRVSLLEYYNNVPTETQEVKYTSFNMIQDIREGQRETRFHYWPNGERSGMESYNNGSLETFKIYGPDYEREMGPNGNKTYTYIRGPEGNVIAILGNENQNTQNYAVLTDHLGSFTHIIDKDGNIVEEKSFDAWGRLRDPSTWIPYASNLDAGQPYQLFDRGYTGHEHLAQYGIINMNGRLYDPVLGRMFSPDPYIMGANNFQGYNRYSYALNNPLSYTDPSGHFLIAPILIGIAYGAIIGAASSAAMYSVMAGGKWNWADFGKAALYGGIAGGISGGIGGAAAASGGGAFFQSAGFSIIKTAASQIATNLIMGQKINASTIIGSIAGGFVAGGMPQFSGVSGGAFANIVGEVAQSGVTSGTAGFVSGGVAAGLNGDNILGGAFVGMDGGIKGGLAQTAVMIGTFGAGIVPNEKIQEHLRKMESNEGIAPGRFTPLFRRGGLYGTIISRGVTWGRNLVIPRSDDDNEAYTYIHEYAHYLKTVQTGFGNMQGRGIWEQARDFFGGPNPYETKGMYEYEADQWTKGTR